jgi:hypothetical protein
MIGGNLIKMPYTYRKDSKTGKTCVYKKDGGKKVGCTSGPVSKYLGALHANANENYVKEEFDTVLSPPLKISGLIKELYAFKKQHGDVPVNLVDSESGRYVNVNGVSTIYPESVNGAFDRSKPVNGVSITTRMHKKDKIQELKVAIKAIRPIIQESLREQGLIK